MKTQISVLVKGETMMGKMTKNVVWFVGLVTKSKVLLVLDGKEHELEESKDPYVFDVEPGQHQIQFVDPKKANKDFMKGVNKATAGVLGFAVGGGSFTLAESAASLVPGSEIEGGAANIMLNEGDILKLSCQNTGSGVPKVKVLKK